MNQFVCVWGGGGGGGHRAAEGDNSVTSHFVETCFYDLLALSRNMGNAFMEAM